MEAMEGRTRVYIPQDKWKNQTVYLGNVCKACMKWWQQLYFKHGAYDVKYVLVEPLECDECEGESQQAIDF